MTDKGIIVLSLFDGMACCRIALKELGIKVDKYYASEIDKHAIKQTQLNFPDTIQLGNGWTVEVIKHFFKELPFARETRQKAEEYK